MLNELIVDIRDGDEGAVWVTMVVTSQDSAKNLLDNPGNQAWENLSKVWSRRALVLVQSKDGL